MKQRHAVRKSIVNYSLLMSTPLPLELVLCTAGIVQNEYAKSQICRVLPALVHIHLPPWGGVWPPGWEMTEKFEFATGKLTSVTTILSSRENGDFRAAVCHELKVIPSNE